MCDFIVCRVCLSNNKRVHSIANTPLQDIYENLTRIKLLVHDGWPVTVCYVCHLQLQKCLKLVDLASNSQKQLLELYHSGIGLSIDTVLMLDHTRCTYSVTPIESISLNAADLEEKTVKDEGETVKQEPELKNVEEPLSDVEKDEPEFKVDLDYYDNELLVSSDPEDNIPLTEFKGANQIVKREKIKTEKRGYHRDIKINAQEMMLTKEQQTDAVIARSKSLNYLNSPYKCHLCYKGFVNEVTYSNHTQKHDENSGPYKCDVCALRYRSARLLRTHAMVSHARCFKCNMCEHVSHTANQARDHDRWHDGFTFQCQLCNQKFRKRTSYLTHTRKNHPTECICELCGYSFVSKNGLLLHKSKSHKLDKKDEKPVPADERFCASCNIQFACLDAYHRHLLSSDRHSHSYTNSIQCIVCKQTHTDHESLTEHIKIHKKKLLHPTPVTNLGSVLAQLPCDVCGASFSSRSRLSAHVSRKHLGVKYVKNVVCEQCGLQFKSGALLRYHQRRHRGLRPHACPGCPRSFTDAHALRLHARTHSGERPYKCHTCDKRFTQKPALNRHYRVHTGAKPYTCQVCSKCFSQSNSLKIHVQSVHLKMPPPHRKRKRASTSKIDGQAEIDKEN